MADENPKKITEEELARLKAERESGGPKKITEEELAALRGTRSGPEILGQREAGPAPLTANTVPIQGSPYSDYERSARGETLARGLRGENLRGIAAKGWVPVAAGLESLGDAVTQHYAPTMDEMYGPVSNPDVPQWSIDIAKATGGTAGMLGSMAATGIPMNAAGMAAHGFLQSGSLGERAVGAASGALLGAGMSKIPGLYVRGAGNVSKEAQQAMARAMQNRFARGALVDYPTFFGSDVAAQSFNPSEAIDLAASGRFGDIDYGEMFSKPEDISGAALRSIGGAIGAVGAGDAIERAGMNKAPVSRVTGEPLVNPERVAWGRRRPVSEKQVALNEMMAEAGVRSAEAEAARAAASRDRLGRVRESESRAQEKMAADESARREAEVHSAEEMQSMKNYHDEMRRVRAEERSMASAEDAELSRIAGQVAREYSQQQSAGFESRQAESRAARDEQLRQLREADAIKFGEARGRVRHDVESRRQASDQAAREAQPGGDVYLGMGPGQMLWESGGRVVRKLSEGARDRQRKMQQDWGTIGDQSTVDIPFSLTATTHNRFVRGDLASPAEMVQEIGRIPRPIRKPENIRVPEEGGTPGGLQDIIRDKSRDQLGRVLGKDVVDEIFDIAQKSKDFAESGRSRFRRRQGEVVPHKSKGVDTKDRTRAYQEIAGGKQNSPLLEATLRADHAAEVAGMKMKEMDTAVVDDIFSRNGVSRHGQDPVIATKLLEKFPSRGDRAKFLADPEVQKLLLESSDPRRMMELVSDARDYYDNWFELRDAHSRAVNGIPMPRFTDSPYVNRAPKRGGAFDPKAAWAYRTAHESKRIGGEVSDASRVRSGTRMMRTGTDPNKVQVGDRMLDREMNLYTLMNEYGSQSIREIVGDARIRENQFIARAFRVAGDPERAESIKKLTMQAFNSEKHGLAAALDTWARPEVRAILAANKRAFDKAKYSINPKFTLLRQWTSLLNQAARNPVQASKIVADFADPDAYNAISKLYAAKAKSSKSAGLSRQADGTLIGSGGSNKFSKGDKVQTAKKAEEMLLSGMSDAMERMTVMASGMIARRVGISQGRSGRDLANFISDEIGKTQSYYDSANRAALLNSRVVQGLVPAQSFGVELMNQVREQMGLTGAYNEQGNAISARNVYNLGAVLGAAIGGNILTSYLAGYQDNTPEGLVETAASTLPFSGVFLGVGPGDGQMLSAGQIADVGKALDYMDRGEYDEAYRLIARNWQPAGTLTGDLATGRLQEWSDDLRGKTIGGEDSGGARQGTRLGGTRQQATRRTGERR